MTAYYNEFDPQAAEWLRILILQGNIAPGFVDERSIVEVDPDELRQYTQCHFFAGIGGWSYALRLAGWPDDRPCWTGSPPCQPFSNAGKQKAQEDARHLWPVFFDLISKCKPPAIFGEQVEAAIRTGWLDDLQDDLEAEGYATGKIILPACGFGAPHIRQRIWFVAERLADSDSERHVGINTLLFRQEPGRLAQDRAEVAGGSEASRLANTNGEQNNATDPRGLHAESFSEGRDGGLADTESIGKCADESGRDSGKGQQLVGSESRGNSFYDGTVSTTNAPDSFWSAPDWLYCRDGKWRPVESGTFPLAHGVSGRVGLLRGYGNAIVPEVAAEVIKAYMGS